MTATTAFFHFAKKIHNRRRIPENPRIVAVGDVLDASGDSLKTRNEIIEI